MVNDIVPNYLNEIFQWAPERNKTLRSNYCKSKHPFRKTTDNQNLLSFLEPLKWTELPESIKKLSNINTFKHNLKIFICFNLLINKHVYDNYDCYYIINFHITVIIIYYYLFLTATWLSHRQFWAIIAETAPLTQC